MKQLKTIIIAATMGLLSSCSPSNLEGYDGDSMKEALRIMNNMNYSTRVYQATGGRYHPTIY